LGIFATDRNKIKKYLHIHPQNINFTIELGLIYSRFRGDFMCAFWKGKIELNMPKYSFHPGENMTGTISLKLKKPIKARKVEVRFLGQEKITRRRRSSDGRMRTDTDTITICDIEVPLDGEKEYQNETYDFNITVPPDVLETAKRPDGALGGLLQAAEYMSGQRRRKEFHIIANLDIPMGFDVSKKQDIVIT
jgi:hypothetical protein